MLNRVVAHRVISLLRSNLVASGVKRTSITEPDCGHQSQSRIYEYTPLITRAYLPDAAAHFRKIQLSHKDNAPRSVALYVPRLPGGVSMRRREFITLLGATSAFPFSVGAQQPAMPVIGFFHSASPETRRDQVVAFRQGLKDAGFVEGENVAIEYRWAGDQYDRLPDLAADLVRRRVAVIAATGNIATALAAKARTTTIPIVFMNSGDPVQAGLVASLNRPGGNITGVSNMAVELGAKQLGLLHELVPGDALIAVLVNPNSPITESFIADLRLAASAIGRQIEILTATTNREIDAAFAGLTQKQIRALVVGLDTLFLSRRVQLITLTTRHAVPTMHPFREDVEAGGLMSYGPSNLDQYRHAGVYTGRILKGEKPAETPVQRPTKFEFVINLQTAKVIGIEIPPTLLARADEVIE
jgi:putative ABC transport system substrate-binding protein